MAKGKKSLRARLNDNASTVMTIAVIVLLLCAGIWFWPSGGARDVRFYSTDDGKTFFKHQMDLPPFTFEGKEAVQAMVFQCGTGKPFVGYLMRFTDAGKKQERENLAHPTPARMNGMADVPETQVKRPGEGDWVTTPHVSAAARFAAASALPDAKEGSYNDIVTIKCPDGRAAHTVSPAALGKE